MSGDFPCCEHCPEDKIHDVLLDEHDVPCTLCNPDPEVAALRAELARQKAGRALEQNALRNALDRFEAVRALHPRVLRLEVLCCGSCAVVWPCPTIRALDGNSPDGAGSLAAKDARIDAIEATARMVLAEAQRHLDDRDARLEAVRALLDPDQDAAQVLRLGSERYFCETDIRAALDDDGPDTPRSLHRPALGRPGAVPGTQVTPDPVGPLKSASAQGAK